jgi:hypothetical protein
MVLAEVRSRMLVKLAASGLTAQDAKKIKITPMLTPPAAITWPPQKAPGFALPYYDFDGNPTGFYRYRYLEPQLVRNGAGLKALRYSQPSLPPEPHFPALLNWKEFFALPAAERRLFITEGELKSMCGCKRGFPTIGLGGVWNFRSGTESFIKGLKSLDWAGAKVYIVFDSDSINNYQILIAQNKLAREVLDLSAEVYLVQLPALTPEAKTGLDDYLEAKGNAEFEALIEETKPWTFSRHLHELNEEVVCVRDPGSIIELRTMQRMGKEIFTGVVYANRTWDEIEYVNRKGKLGTKVSKKSAAKAWLEWPARGEVQRTTYAPGEARILVTKELNTWTGWGVAEEHIKKGSVDLWHKFMGYLFEGADKADRVWFERWLAAPIQQPGLKLFSAAVLHSTAQGAGKTLVGHTMQQLYGKNFIEIGEHELTGNFNGWAENKQFVLGEEITGGDKRGSADRLKAIITRNTILLNPKYIPEYTVPDRINYLFTSNHVDSFFLDDEDRRYFVHELRCGRLIERDAIFVKAYDAWYHSPQGAGALMHYLQHLDMGDFSATAPARETNAKRQMIEMGRSDVDSWAAELRRNPAEVLRLPGAPAMKNTLMTTTTLFRLWNPTDEKSKAKLTRNGLSRALRARGFRQAHHGEPIGVKGGVVRLWIVQGADMAEKENWSPKKIGELYDQEQGTWPIKGELK